MGKTATKLREIIDTAETNPSSQALLRTISRHWSERVPVKYLKEIGEILLQSHLDERKEFLREN